MTFAKQTLLLLSIGIFIATGCSGGGSDSNPSTNTAQVDNTVPIGPTTIEFTSVLWDEENGTLSIQCENTGIARSESFGFWIENELNNSIGPLNRVPELAPGAIHIISANHAQLNNYEGNIYLCMDSIPDTVTIIYTDVTATLTVPADPNAPTWEQSFLVGSWDVQQTLGWSGGTIGFNALGEKTSGDSRAPAFVISNGNEVTAWVSYRLYGQYYTVTYEGTVNNDNSMSGTADIYANGSFLNEATWTATRIDSIPVIDNDTPPSSSS